MSEPIPHDIEAGLKLLQRTDTIIVGLIVSSVVAILTLLVVVSMD